RREDYRSGHAVGGILTVVRLAEWARSASPRGRWTSRARSGFFRVLRGYRALGTSAGDCAASVASWRNVQWVCEIHEARKDQSLRELRRRQPRQRMYAAGSHRTDSAAPVGRAIAVLLHEPAGCADAP